MGSVAFEGSSVVFPAVVGDPVGESALVGRRSSVVFPVLDKLASVVGDPVGVVTVEIVVGLGGGLGLGQT